MRCPAATASTICVEVSPLNTLWIASRNPVPSWLMRRPTQRMATVLGWKLQKGTELAFGTLLGHIDDPFSRHQLLSIH